MERKSTIYIQIQWSLRLFSRQKQISECAHAKFAII